MGWLMGRWLLRARHMAWGLLRMENELPGMLKQLCHLIGRGGTEGEALYPSNDGHERNHIIGIEEGRHHWSVSSLGARGR
jgi:hypothetical protein